MKLATADTARKNPVSDILEKNETALLNDWMKEQLAAIGKHTNLKESDLKQQCADFFKSFKNALQINASGDIKSSAWDPVLKILTDVSQKRGEQGFSPSETALFVFSFKKPLFAVLSKQLANDGAQLAESVWNVTELLDKLGLYTTEVYQKARESVIARQQQDMLELSTPVVSMADGILALPLIGTLDSARTQVVMESLLQRIIESGSTVAIIDITGVPTVDTLVAQHLLKTVTAARLMGADCIISGIRPQIAQTIVHLGVELGNVATKATLASAFKLALERTGMAITRVKAEVKSQPERK